MKMPGAAEDAMPEAGNRGARRPSPGGWGDFDSREVALCTDCAPNYLVSIGGPARLCRAGGGRRPAPELQGPRSELQSPEVVGEKGHAEVAEVNLCEEKELKWPKARRAFAQREARCQPSRGAGRWALR